MAGQSVESACSRVVPRSVKGVAASPAALIFQCMNILPRMHLLLRRENLLLHIIERSIGSVRASFSDHSCVGNVSFIIQYLHNFCNNQETGHTLKKSPARGGAHNSKFIEEAVASLSSNLAAGFAPLCLPSCHRLDQSRSWDHVFSDVPYCGGGKKYCRDHTRRLSSSKRNPVNVLIILNFGSRMLQFGYG